MLFHFSKSSQILSKNRKNNISKTDAQIAKKIIDKTTTFLDDSDEEEGEGELLDEVFNEESPRSGDGKYF